MYVYRIAIAVIHIAYILKCRFRRVPNFDKGAWGATPPPTPISGSASVKAMFASVEPTST